MEAAPATGVRISHTLGTVSETRTFVHKTAPIPMAFDTVLPLSKKKVDTVPKHTSVFVRIPESYALLQFGVAGDRCHCPISALPFATGMIRMCHLPKCRSQARCSINKLYKE